MGSGHILSGHGGNGAAVRQRDRVPANHGESPVRGFYVEAAYRLAGMQHKLVKGEWICPHSANVLQVTGLRTLEH